MQTKSVRQSALSIVVIVVGLISGCGVKFTRNNNEQDKQTAIAATAKFHSLLNDGKFEEIYEMTDRRARETKSKDRLISILATMRNDRGPVLRSDLIDSTIETRALYREVHLSFRTQFSSQTVIEQFVWYVSDNKAGLFSIESN